MRSTDGGERNGNIFCRLNMGDEVTAIQTTHGMSDEIDGPALCALFEKSVHAL